MSSRFFEAYFAIMTSEAQRARPQVNEHDHKLQKVYNDAPGKVSIQAIFAGDADSFNRVFP